MYSFRIFVSFFALFLALPLGVAEPDHAKSVTQDLTKAEPVSVSVDPDTRIVDFGENANESEGNQERLDSALLLFSDRSLALPDLEIAFFDDETACSGHLGLFLTSTSPWSLLVCSELGFVLIHELAHAWTEANMSDLDRQAYSASRGLAGWDDINSEWQDRAEEDAAVVFQKVLMRGLTEGTSEPSDEVFGAFIRLNSYSIDEADHGAICWLVGLQLSAKAMASATPGVRAS